MVSDPGVLPGFLAVGAGGSAPIRALRSVDGISRLSCGGVAFAHWGLAGLTDDTPLMFALSPVIRTVDGVPTPLMITNLLRDDPGALTRLLPPFAAVAGSSDGVIMVTDSMGFRQTYHTTPGAAGSPALATSALHAAQAHASKLDDTAFAVQSLLGWQLGQRTLFTGVEKQAPGVVCQLTDGQVTIQHQPPDDDAVLTLDEAVLIAAGVLRKSLERTLDDHPDAVLQLTGGQDSRLLLSAVPRGRRRGLRAMTLGVSGPDVEVATELARRYGLQHEVHGLAGLDDISPAEAWAVTRTAASRLDGMSDPIAHAALTIGESSFEQGVRISGLGGEVARGFYYLGKVRERAVTKAEARQLAAWRMFSNEAVEAGLLTSDFSSWAREVADREVLGALMASGKDWDRATDDLYLRHRMQRWAGGTDTAVASQRTVINPMLHSEFLTVATRLSPTEKANSLFLARLQMELDPELGRIRLEGRPAPITYAERTLLHRSSQRVTTGKRLADKAVQRIRGGRRAPAGGDVLAAKVVAHWRQKPELLSAARDSGFLSDAWLDGMLDKSIYPKPSSVAFLTNLMIAAETTTDRSSSLRHTHQSSTA